MNDGTPPSLSHLAVVTSNYPAPACPTHGTFVRQFAHAVARQGVQCTVIQPVAVHRALGKSGYPFHEFEQAGDNQVVRVFRPRFFSLSARDAFACLGPLNPSLFTLRRFTGAVRRVLRIQNIQPDALYGHFLYLAGAAAVRLGSERGIPSFPCVGEGELWTVRWFGVPQAKEDLAKASGFLANSTALKRTLIQDLGITTDRIGVFPNGTDLSKFNPRDKVAARLRFGLPVDRFLVVSVGNFLMKKGVVRVGEAIEGLEGVSGVFAGSGPVPPHASNTALCRRIPHSDMPALLSACDVFVLPTLVEGSCNAIVESMACGLPVISSSGDFNDDVLSADMSIRVDPMDVAAIRQAILKLRDDEALRIRMANAALLHSRRFDINNRAQKVLAFMKESSPKNAIIPNNTCLDPS